LSYIADFEEVGIVMEYGEGEDDDESDEGSNAGSNVGSNVGSNA